MGLETISSRPGELVKLSKDFRTNVRNMNQFQNQLATNCYGQQERGLNTCR